MTIYIAIIAMLLIAIDSDFMLFRGAHVRSGRAAFGQVLVRASRENKQKQGQRGPRRGCAGRVEAARVLRMVLLNNRVR